jgi:UDP-N-acetylglucosamine 3-dehydrogenase
MLTGDITHMTESQHTAPVRIALISLAHGHGYSYAAAVQAAPNAELVVISDDNGERGKAASERFGVPWEADYRETVQRDDIDAVIICSENSRHKEMTIAAAEAGKHVLCEKPLSTNVADGQSMIDACAKAGVQLQIAFPVRFHAAVVALKEAVQSGKIGTPLAIAARNPGRCPHSWFVDPDLAGGGAVIDHTVHVVDVLRWMFDAEVTEVFAEIDTRMYDIPVDDTGLLMLRLSNGLPASLDTSWSRPASWPIWGGVMIDVVGEDGVISLDAFNDNLQMSQNDGPPYSYVGVEHSGDPEMVESFLDAIQHGTEVKVNGVDGLRAVEVALAAYESAKVGVPVAIAH